MSDETKPPVDLTALTLNQLEQTLFSDSSLEVTDRSNERGDPAQAMQALLDAQVVVEADAEAEAKMASANEVEVPAEPAAEPQEQEAVGGPQDDPAQKYMVQNQQILNYLAEQQKAQAEQKQQQAEQARVQAHQQANSDEAINQAIAQAGLNPSDPMHQFAYRQSMESNQMEQRLQEMEQRVKLAERQAFVSKAQMNLSPQIDETLSAYGDVPKATLDTIKSNAASAMAHGYEQQQSIDMAVAPYLDLLRHMKDSAKPAAPVSPQTPPTRTRDNASLIAASLTGRSTGHGKTIENLSIDDIEKALFR